MDFLMITQVPCTYNTDRNHTHLTSYIGCREGPYQTLDVVRGAYTIDGSTLPQDYVEEQLCGIRSKKYKEPFLTKHTQHTL